MSVLHWICALTLALVCSLTAQPVKRETYNEIKKFIGVFKDTFKKAGCPETEYYTPTDVSNNNLVAALNCCIEELKVIYQECMTDETKDLYEIYDNLSYTLGVKRDKFMEKQSQAGTHDDLTCESSTPKPFETFMDNIETLMQQINSQ